MSRTDNPISQLEPLFNPSSIAVIGASQNPDKPGGRPINALLDKGYRGRIYPVNPARQTINGIKCYPSILEVPDQVDLAIVSVAAEQVYHTLEECIAKGVQAAVIFSSGFAEMGPEGREEQKRITHLARKSGLRMLGPNCLGLVNTLNGVMASFAFIVDLPELPEKDRVLGFVTQSGYFGSIIYASALDKGVGFNYFISVGNEADLEFADLLDYMVHDPYTKLMGGYLEGAKDGGKLRRVAEEALEKEKPILVMKVGRTSAGSRAAASHTGSLAGSDLVYDAFFRQTGILRIDDYTDLIAFTPLFLSGRLPRGRNTAIIATSGGAGVTMSDLCESLGLNVIPLREETREKMDRVLPSYASSKNPVDLTAAFMTRPELVVDCLKAVCADPEVDIVICSVHFLSTPPDDPIIKEIIEVCKGTDKLVLMNPFVFPGTGMDPGSLEIARAGIPTNPDTRNTIRALSFLALYSENLVRRRGPEYRVRPAGSTRPDLDGLIRPGQSLSESEAKAVLTRYGVPVTREALAATPDQAVARAREIGYPVVLKVDSPDILHKTEAGALKLNLNNDQEVRAAFGEILGNARSYKPGARINGVLVQEMLPGGTEVIVGVTRDPVFGPVVMFGLGGIFVEVLKDVSFRVAPVSPGDAREMIEEIKGSAVLRGVRGKPAVDVEAIVDVILKVSDLVTDYRDSIEELDINPLVAYPKGVKAADAVLVTRG